MTIKITKQSEKRVQKVFRKLDTFAKEDFVNTLEDIAFLLFSSIQERVQRKGTKKYKGKIYSRAYAKFRKVKGRQVSHKDLTFSGRMWSAKGVLKRPHDVKMFFSSAEEADKAMWNHAKTPFFHLAQPEASILRTEIKKAMERILK